MTWYVNVNKQTIARNIHDPEPEPVISFRKGKSGKATYCYELELPAGSRMIYDPHNPILKCGARLVVACDEQPRVIR